MLSDQHKVKLLYVDALNFAASFFPIDRKWNVTQAFKFVRQFVDAASRQEIKLKCFIDDCSKSNESVGKYRKRREIEVVKGKKNVPQGLTILLGDMFRAAGVEVCYSNVADNDDSLAAHAQTDQADILSNDKDMFRYIDYTYTIYGSYKFQQNQLLLVLKDISHVGKHSSSLPFILPPPVTNPYVSHLQLEEISPIPLLLTSNNSTKSIAHDILQSQPRVYYYLRGVPTPLLRCYRHRYTNTSPHKILTPLRRYVFYIKYCSDDNDSTPITNTIQNNHSTSLEMNMSMNVKVAEINGESNMLNNHTLTEEWPEWDDDDSSSNHNNNNHRNNSTESDNPPVACKRHRSRQGVKWHREENIHLPSYIRAMEHTYGDHGSTSANSCSSSSSSNNNNSNSNHNSNNNNNNNCSSSSNSNNNSNNNCGNNNNNNNNSGSSNNNNGSSNRRRRRGSNSNSSNSNSVRMNDTIDNRQDSHIDFQKSSSSSSFNTAKPVFNSFKEEMLFYLQNPEFAVAHYFPGCRLEHPPAPPPPLLPLPPLLPPPPLLPLPPLLPVRDETSSIYTPTPLTAVHSTDHQSHLLHASTGVSVVSGLLEARAASSAFSAWSQGSAATATSINNNTATTSTVTASNNNNSNNTNTTTSTATTTSNNNITTPTTSNKNINTTTTTPTTSLSDAIKTQDWQKHQFCMRSLVYETCSLYTPNNKSLLDSWLEYEANQRGDNQHVKHVCSSSDRSHPRESYRDKRSHHSKKNKKKKKSYNCNNNNKNNNNHNNNYHHNRNSKYASTNTSITTANPAAINHTNNNNN